MSKQKPCDREASPMIQQWDSPILITDKHYLVMNSMVLTSGEVTGLSQDRVSKQDTVAGKHRSKCCDELIPQ